jgi:hypothetical protein
MFAASCADRPDAAGFEGLGWAAYGRDDADACIQAREEAFRRYVDDGRVRDAARVAAWLASDAVEFRGEAAVASGWIERAVRLLDGLQPSPDHGWVAGHRGSFVLGSGDTAQACRLGRDAAELGRAFSVPELEMVGLGLEGICLVLHGEVQRGMRCLDEASAVALSGTSPALVCMGWALCYVITACELVGDLDRAVQWCGRVEDYSRRHQVSLTLGLCRIDYASVLVRRGEWTRGEAELRTAQEILSRSRPAMAELVTPKLAELRSAKVGSTTLCCSPARPNGLPRRRWCSR